MLSRTLCSMAQTVDWSGMCNPQCKETTELKFTFLSGNHLQEVFPDITKSKVSVDLTVLDAT